MTKPECRMTKEIRNPNVEGRSGVRSPDASFGFRYSFGFRHSSFGFTELRFMERFRWRVLPGRLVELLFLTERGQTQSAVSAATAPARAGLVLFQCLVSASQ